MKIIIYYRNCKVKNRILKNNITHKNDKKLTTSHVVYEVQCPRGDCSFPNASYIGQTRNEILTRMNQHRQIGAILEHMSTQHHIATVSLDELSSNIKILKVIPDFNKLIIYEALTILHKKPDLNRPIDNFVNPLKLFARSYHPAPPARVTPPHIRKSL